MEEAVGWTKTLINVMSLIKKSSAVDREQNNLVLLLKRMRMLTDNVFDLQRGQ